MTVSCALGTFVTVHSSTAVRRYSAIVLRLLTLARIFAINISPREFLAASHITSLVSRQ